MEESEAIGSRAVNSGQKMCSSYYTRNRLCISKEPGDLVEKKIKATYRDRSI
jgi:hypothetical protein